MKIELNVSEKNEGTESPWWVLIDPKTIHEMFLGSAEHGEVPDFDRVLTAIAFSIEGPYFSRKEAEDYLKSRPYAYSSEAKVWCASGYRANQYKKALKTSKPSEISYSQGFLEGYALCKERADKLVDICKELRGIYMRQYGKIDFEQLRTMAKDLPLSNMAIEVLILEELKTWEAYENEGE